jgi:hypothetical protein
MLIADLAARTLARIERLGGPRVGIGRRELMRRFVVDGREIGKGYGRMTARGTDAIRTLAKRGATERDRSDAAPAGSGRADDRGPRLDGVYSAKAAAALLRLHRDGIGPLIFWASKSHAILERPAREEITYTHPALLRWLRK